MRIQLVTDAWAPQVNGVVVTLRNTVKWLERWGHEVRVLSPEGFRTMPMPTLHSTSRQTASKLRN